METIEYALPPGTLLKGKDYNYEITKALGQGSFGITYQAVTRIQGNLGELPTMVSVKEFFMENTSIRGNENEVYAIAGKETHAYYMRKFWEEAHKLAFMKHPGIVKVLEIFSQHGTYYYVMEYLPGGTLNDRIKDSKPLTLGEILNYTEKIACALKYMHEHEHPMLHLDLKPDNIMLNAENCPVLIDFGLAKHFDKDGNPETGTSIGLGTEGYAPLEQSEYQDSFGIRPAMDVYALGATLFKLLTRETPPTVAVLINNSNLLGDKLKQCQVPDSVIDLVIHAMQLKSIERIADMRTFLEELESARISIKKDILNQPLKRLTPVPPVVPEPEEPDTDDEETVISDDVNAGLQPVVNEEKGKGNSDNDETTNIDGSDTGNADGESVGVENNGNDIKIEDNHQEEESVNDDSKDNDDSEKTGLSGDVVKPVTIKTRLMKYKNHLLGGVAVLVVGVFLLLLSQIDTPEEKFRQAEAHYAAGDYGKAVTEFTYLAQEDHAPSQWYLGKCNETGQGVKANASAAFEWYLKAANQGYDKAIYDLALCYEKGIGTDVDEDMAIEWYKRLDSAAAKERLAELACHFSVNMTDDKVILSADKCPDCRIVSVTLDYFSQDTHYTYKHKLSSSKEAIVYPKANCTVIYSYQHKNRAVRQDSLAFNFNETLEWAIRNRNRDFVQQVMPYDKEINIWFSESEGYIELPSMDKLNKWLDDGYKITGFNFDRNQSTNLDAILNSTSNHYSRISELFLTKSE